MIFKNTGIYPQHHLLQMVFMLLCTLLLLATVPAFAATDAIAQSYQTHDTGIVEGTLVSLSSPHSDLVTSASSTNAASLVGVAASNPLVALSGGGTNNLQVVVSGTVDAMVSDSNGPVNVGDKITVSPITGIGMKATAAGEIVGTAQESLASIKTVTKSLAGTSGHAVPVKVGLLPIAVNIGFYSSASSGGSISSYVPLFLQDVANALTGKQVSPLRVLLGATALLLGFVAVTGMLYTATRSGITSIGRNPLAEGALRKGLLDVIIAAIGVLAISMVAVYAILFS